MILNNEDLELLDIINESDIVLDSKPRTLIHKEGLLHREVHVWFFDEDKNIFFQKRGLEKSSAGLLDATVGGHVDKGEDYLDAAVREAKEETGISFDKSDLILLRKFRNTWKNEHKNIINNFIRAIFIYKNPIKESDIKKELEVLGVGFEKFYVDQFMTLKDSGKALFDEYILTDEVPEVIRYINSIEL